MRHSGPSSRTSWCRSLARSVVPILPFVFGSFLLPVEERIRDFMNLKPFLCFPEVEPFRWSIRPSLLSGRWTISVFWLCDFDRISLRLVPSLFPRAFRFGWDSLDGYKRSYIKRSLWVCHPCVRRLFDRSSCKLLWVLANFCLTHYLGIWKKK